MNISTMIAILSLLVAVFARPIERVWDKPPKIKLPILKIRLKRAVFDFVILLAIPISMLIYIYFFATFNKSNIVSACLCSALISMYYTRKQSQEVFDVLHDRISLLEEVLEEAGLVEEDPDDIH